MNSAAVESFDPLSSPEITDLFRPAQPKSALGREEYISDGFILFPFLFLFFKTRVSPVAWAVLELAL